MESIEAIINKHITALWLLDRITCFTKSIKERLKEALKADSDSSNVALLIYVLLKL